MFIEDSKKVGFIFERSTLTGEGSAEYLATVDNLARKSCDGMENFRTDEGTDWRSHAVAEVVQDRGIHHQLALVDAHGQIGQVESRFRLYHECANAMLRACGAPMKFKFMAIKFINYIQNNVVRDGGSSRLFDLLGIDSAVMFYPFWCPVTAVAPRHKQGEGFGTGKEYRLVGFSSQHKGGYLLWNAETDRVVTRGDVHSLKFYPDKVATHTNTQQQDDADGSTTIIYDEEDGIQEHARSKIVPNNGQSMSLSRISHADDSIDLSGSFASSFGNGSGSVVDRTPLPPLCAKVILTIQCQTRQCCEVVYDSLYEGMEGTNG